MAGNTIAFSSFAGGVSQASPANELADDQFVELVNFELSDRRNLRTRQGTTILNDNTALTSRITSVHYFENSLASAVTLCTESNNIRKFNGVDTWSALTGPTIATDTYWDWAQFGDNLIGVNGDVSQANPILIASPSATAYTALSGSPPKATYVTVMNNRVFLVSASNPNQIVVSALGDHEDYTTDPGLNAGTGTWDIGGNEGGKITGIAPYKYNDRSVLVVFKRHRTYALVFGAPNTDQLQWEVELVFDGVGCVSHWSIQQVLGDLVFMSDAGVLSFEQLRRTQGDPGKARLSANIKDLERVTRAVDTYASVVIPEKSQYWLAVPDPNISGTANSVVWVMDFSGMGGQGGQGGVCWYAFKGGVVGASYGLVRESGSTRLYIGSPAGTASYVYRYADDDVYLDGSAAYTRSIITKAYNFGAPYVRKRFYRWTAEFEPQTDPATITISYWFDENTSDTRSIDFSISGLTSGGVWGVSKWDSGKWGGYAASKRDLVRTFSGNPGSHGQSVQFKFFSETGDDALTLRSLSLNVRALTHVGVSDEP